MNSIDLCIHGVQKVIMELWRKNTSPHDRVNKVVNDFYDLIISMFNDKIIKDSQLAMDILKFYYTYKRYRFTDPKDFSGYLMIEKSATAEADRLVATLSSL